MDLHSNGEALSGILIKLRQVTHFICLHASPLLAPDFARCVSFLDSVRSCPSQRSETGISRHGTASLRYDEPLLRLRPLAGDVLPELPPYLSDLSLPLSQANRLTVTARRIFIVENKQTFLAFPPLKGGLAIWDKGFAVALLRERYWPREPDTWFWGDLDAQGFQMLHQWRSYLSQTRSLLMDERTYEAFGEYAGSVTPPTPMLPQLNEAEQALYQRLLSTLEALAAGPRYALAAGGVGSRARACPGYWRGASSASNSGFPRRGSKKGSLLYTAGWKKGKPPVLARLSARRAASSWPSAARACAR